MLNSYACTFPWQASPMCVLCYTSLFGTNINLRRSNSYQNSLRVHNFVKQDCGSYCDGPDILWLAYPHQGLEIFFSSSKDGFCPAPEMKLSYCSVVRGLFGSSVLWYPVFYWTKMYFGFKLNFKVIILYRSIFLVLEIAGKTWCAQVLKECLVWSKSHGNYHSVNIGNHTLVGCDSVFFPFVFWELPRMFVLKKFGLSLNSPSTLRLIIMTMFSRGSCIHGNYDAKQSHLMFNRPYMVIKKVCLEQNIFWLVQLHVNEVISCSNSPLFTMFLYMCNIRPKLVIVLVLRERPSIDVWNFFCLSVCLI